MVNKPKTTQLARYMGMMHPETTLFPKCSLVGVNDTYSTVEKISFSMHTVRHTQNENSKNTLEKILTVIT